MGTDVSSWAAPMARAMVGAMVGAIGGLHALRTWLVYYALSGLAINYFLLSIFHYVSMDCARGWYITPFQGLRLTISHLLFSKLSISKFCSSLISMVLLKLFQLMMIRSTPSHR